MNTLMDYAYVGYSRKLRSLHGNWLCVVQSSLKPAFILDIGTVVIAGSNHSVLSSIVLVQGMEHRHNRHVTPKPIFTHALKFMCSFALSLVCSRPSVRAFTTLICNVEIFSRLIMRCYAQRPKLMG